MISHIRIERLLEIFAQEAPRTPKTQKWRNFREKNSKKILRGKNHQKSLYTYVRNRVIFLLSPVPSKNIENCDLRNILNEPVFEKIFFRVSGIPPKWKRVENFWFQKLLEIILMVILSPHMGILGENWRHGVTYKSKNVKIEIGLNPLP